MDAYRDKKVIAGLLKTIGKKARSFSSSCRIMEVCGTHTMTIHKYGLQAVLEDLGIEMVSGPGCPVCITPNEIHEAAIALLTGRTDLILATFGDMTRVPTRLDSLQNTVPLKGSSIKIVYSPEESLELARQKRDKSVVFFGAGFETTIPSIAFLARQAAREKLRNYSILSALWLIPPPLKTILESGEIKISGFLYPGHVSAIIGLEPYRFIARDYGFPGAVAGFEPGDILLGISSVLEQLKEGTPRVANEYSRVVPEDGNAVARRLMEEVLEPKDAHWRGLGMIPRSGLRLRRPFKEFDAEVKFGLDIQAGSGDLPGCRCGEVLRGLVSPRQCGLFAKKCSPDFPCGPCMVSFEGACFVHYRYRDKNFS